MKSKKTPLNPSLTLPLKRAGKVKMETLNKDEKSNGQSLIDVIFSMGILALMLTGVVALMVATTKVKTMKLERKKMVELSQLLIEQKILEIKNNPLVFWDETVISFDEAENKDKDASEVNPSFSAYTYDVGYSSCDKDQCNIIFTVKSGVGQSLSVERLFLRNGI